MSRRILLLSLSVSVPPSRPSNGEDDEMAEKEGETKYANINKEEGGRDGRKDMRRRRRRTPKEWRREERTGDGAAQRPRSFSGHISAHDRADEK